MTKKPINIRIDTELWERVQRSAKGRGMTATAVVEEALGKVLDQRVDLPEVAHGALTQGMGSTGHHHDPNHVLPSPGSCPYTAKQLQGKTGLPLAACQRHIDNGTWRSLL